MNKYRTHNCSELSEKDINKNALFLDGFIEKRPWKSFVHRFTRSLWNNSMCN